MPKRLYIICFILLAATIGYFKISMYQLQNPRPQKLNVKNMKLYAAVEKRGDMQLLVLRDENNKSSMVKEFTSNTLSNNEDFRLMPNYGMWDKYHTKFWGYLSDSNNSVTHIFSIVPAEEFAITTYKTDELLGVQPRELAINPDTEHFVYSTSKGLFNFSLKENNTETIATSEYWAFKPVWQDSTTLQYKSPNSEKMEILVVSN